MTHHALLGWRHACPFLNSTSRKMTSPLKALWEWRHFMLSLRVTQFRRRLISIRVANPRSWEFWKKTFWRSLILVILWLLVFWKTWSVRLRSSNNLNYIYIISIFVIQKEAHYFIPYTMVGYRQTVAEIWKASGLDIRKNNTLFKFF